MAILILSIYKREAYKVQDENHLKKVYGYAIKDLLRGILLGSGVSLLLKFWGFNLWMDESLILLMPIAFGFMFVNPKFGCFSYVVPFTYLVHTLIPRDVSIAFFLAFDYEGLLFLIGILHLIEGVLVFLYGHENNVLLPVYQNHKIVRAHRLRKFWLVPVMGVYAIVCYQDEAPYLCAVKKKRRMGILLTLYGGIILFLSFQVATGALTLGMAMLVMPFLHESTFLCNNIKPLVYKSKKLIN
jgi:hypothetical protein